MMANAIKNKYEFSVLFEVKNGNPNGDPDAGNLPRMDPDTGLGLVTDVCIKRKIRDYVQVVKENVPGFQIYVRNGIPLETNDKMAFSYLGAMGKDVAEVKRKDPEVDLKIRDFMCQNFYDIRTFGAVMTTFAKKEHNLNCGQIRGPVQLGFAQSIDPISYQDMSVVRTSVSTEREAKEKSSTFGKKAIVPYALYRVDGYISANLAGRVTGFSEEDLELFWEALLNMFEHDHSAARGNMSVRRLIVFKHSSEFGDCPAFKLFDALKVSRKEGIENPRCYEDYHIKLHDSQIPDSVTVIEKT